MRTGPSTVWACNEASPRKRCSSGRRSWTDWARTIGMIESERVSAPRRTRSVAFGVSASAIPTPARRRPHHSTQPARGPAPRYRLAAPDSPSRSSTISCSSSPRPGSSVSKTRSTSASTPTGSTTFCVLFWPPCATECPAVVMRTFHQPSGRHSSGCRASTAWMRPKGIDSVVVEVRPDPVRTESRPRESAKLKPLLNWLKVMLAITMSSGITPRISAGSSTAPPTTMPTRISTVITDSQLSAMLPIRRPTGTRTSACVAAASGSMSTSAKSCARSASRPLASA